MIFAPVHQNFNARTWLRFSVSVLYIVHLVMSVVVTHAAQQVLPQSSLVIAQVHVGTSGEASQEFVTVSNNSDLQIDVTDYCLVYSSASDGTQNQLACINHELSNVRLLLNPLAQLATKHTRFLLCSLIQVSIMQ